MTRIYLVLSITCLFFCMGANAQKPDQYGSDNKTAQTLFVEGGGPGIFTINYDQRLKGDQGFGIRAGVGGYGFLKKGVFTIPIGLNYLKGMGNHFAELGVGFCSVSISEGNTYFDNSSSFISGFISFGYRYQPVKTGLSYRVFMSPLFTPAGTIPFYGGASIGIKF